MNSAAFRQYLVVICAGLFVAFSHTAAAKTTLCVVPGGSQSCYPTIQSAVNAASKGDLINVARGTYKEDVVIGKSLSLIGARNGSSVIDATGLPNGILVDGYNNPGLSHVTVSGFTVENALYEGILVLNSSNDNILNNRVLNNDLEGPVFGSGPACNGQPAYETDESGDCGGAIHLMGAAHVTVDGNYITGNADGILISDDSGASYKNVIVNNVVTNNPLECGIVLASHPPVGSVPPNFAPHYGVFNNTVADNVANANGVQMGGAGVGLFSDGEGPGRTSGNLIEGNRLTNNGIPGVALHTHVGPAFGLPPDNLNDNVIIGNFISGNGPDTDDTATPGPTGININSGGGGSPVRGTVISQNVIENEQVDIAVNDPAALDAHFNDLLGGNIIGVANVCALDGAACTGTIDATENYWGCAAGPGNGKCATTSGQNINFAPWLSHRE
jgi:parallel beta-helix repeat protein